MFHKTLQRAFRFNRRERWGLVLLLGGLAGLWGLGRLFPVRPLPDPPVFSSPTGTETKSRGDRAYPPREDRGGLRPLEPFDPNRLSEEEWVQRGLSKRTARTLRNYILKGGRFRRVEDLKKIWGLHPADYDRLRRFIRIPEENRPKDLPAAARKEVKSTWTPYVAAPRRVEAVDINRSDSAQWEALPGIGPGYARRIIRYRDRLGGFVHPDQIGETYQLPDSVFQRIRPYLKMGSTEPIRRISLNAASIDSLGRHPYIGFSKARLIVRYREQHGSFTELRQLLEIVTLDQSWLQRIEPYLMH